MLPKKVQTLCKKFLVELQNNPQHHLKASDRFILYTSFGKLNFYDLPYNYDGQDKLTNSTTFHLSHFTVADFTIAWLAVLTTQKVLPIWERVWPQITFEPDKVTLPSEIVSVATLLLKNEIDIAQVLDVEYDKYDLGGNITFWTSYDVACINVLILLCCLFCIVLKWKWI